MSYRIDPGAPLTAEVRRILGEEVEAALGWLSKAGAEPDKALHECRKRLKAVRALIGLVRSGDKPLLTSENARFRQAARRLAPLREAGALIETVDRLVQAFPGEAAVLAAIRAELVVHRDEVLAGAVEPAVAAAADACRAGLDGLAGIALPDDAEAAADVLANGAARTLRKARDALRRAKARGDAEDFHQLRKAAKAHAMQLSLLKDYWPGPVKARRKAVAGLGESLGELHDVFVLRDLLPARFAGGVPPGAAAVDRLCARSERALRRTCLKQASRLFEDSPKPIARAVERKARRALLAAGEARR